MTSRALILAILISSLGCSSNTAPTHVGGTLQPPEREPPGQARSPALAEPGEPTANVPAPDPREPLLAAPYLALLEAQHIRPHRIDDSVSRKAFKAYLDALDGGKLLLLAPEVEALSRAADKLDDQLRAGNFELARRGAALRRERTRMVANMVAELLATPFDFSVAEALETDPKKQSYAPNEQALRERWRQTLKSDVLDRIARMEQAATAAAKAAEDPQAKQPDAKPELSPKPPQPPLPTTFEGREKKAREDLAKTYAGRFGRLATQDALEAAELFLNSIASVFDPHTRYLAPADQANFDIAISGSLEGIGAVLSEGDQYIEVREIVPGGAAFREGTLEAGDLILAVKQASGEPVDVAHMRIDEVVRMIRGRKGTMVALTVKKPDERVLVIDIPRDVVVVEEAYAKGAILKPKGHAPVGYIQLPSFYGNTRAGRGRAPERDATTDVRALLARLTERGADGLIVDLRGNGGGLLNHATGIAGLFIDQGPVVQVQNSGGEIEVLGDAEPGVSFKGPVVVLVDRFSASASEILAGALKDYGRALIVGTGPTHGKGTVQTLVDLDRMARTTDPQQTLGVLKLTIQQFFLVDGASTQWKGVEPDVVLPDPAAHIESGERFLDGAMPFSAVKAIPVERWNLGLEPAALRKLSAARVAAEPAFGKIAARGQFLIQRREDTQIELELETWKKQRAGDDKALEELDAKLDEGPARLGVELVRYAATDNAADGQAAAKRNGKKLNSWEDGLSRDPWLEEAAQLTNDLLKARPKARGRQ